MDKLPGKIVIASGNIGKLREIARILADLDIVVVPQSEVEGVTIAAVAGDDVAANRRRAWRR